jgi:glycosyltransferase involved in cell wall biosynthesis
MGLARRSGLPWIADFRDPMAQDGYPQDPKTWKQFERIERETIARADVSTFTTPGAAELYRKRYPARHGRITLIENGYDEESFAGIRPQSRIREGHVTLLHSGVVYPKERDPSALIAALRLLKDAEPSSYARLKVRFRAAAHDELIRRLAEQQGVADAIELLPAIGYRAALEEMMSADGLLVLQSASCNEQIPAKLYEYIRAGRPIVALTDACGDTAATLRSGGVDSIAPLDDPRAIMQLLIRFVRAPDEMPLPSQAAVQRASRRGRAEELATLLGRTVAGR